MTALDWQRVKDVFHQALAQPRAARSAFLDAACGSDSVTRAEVERLLDADEEAGAFLEHSPVAGLAGSASRLSTLTGQTLGHYRLSHLLGAGGAGEVYAAVDTELGRAVAIKVVRADGPNAQADLRREAQHASRLNHPHICTIHEVGSYEGRAFIVMEQVEGRPLDELVTGTGLPVDRILRYGAQIADAVAYAHAHGVIHRDLKCANVIITPEGRVKVLDFGLARGLTTERVQELSVSQQAFADDNGEAVAGTLPYMAPELLRGDAATSASDVWALGVMFYEMAAGARPFQGRTGFELCAAILHTEPAPLPPHVPGSFRAIVDRCLVKDPALRVHEAAAVVAAIEATRAGVANLASPRVSIRTRMRRRRPLLAVAAVIAAVVAVAALTLRSRQTTPRLPLADKDVLVLADVTNNTGDPAFDGMLREALAVQLERSPFLKVMDDAQVRESLRLMGRVSDEPVTNNDAREVCIREREKATIGGSITGLGGRYAVMLNANNCETGETLAREQVEANGKAQVLAAIATAATGMRNKLGESLASIEQLERHTVTKVTTPSLEAFQAYARGADQYRRGLFLQAIPFFRRAVELDPDFAMGYQLLGNAYANVGDQAASVQYSKKAFVLIDRVSERERLTISAVHHMLVTGDAAKAADALQLFVQTFPRVPTPRTYRGDFFMLLGEFERGAEDFEEVLRLDPRSSIGHINLFNARLRLGQFDRARDVADRARARRLDAVPIFHQLLLELALIQDDDVAVAQEATWFQGRDEEYLSLDLQATRAIVLGQRRDASELLKRAADQARRRNLHGPADVLSEASTLDPYGECQTQDTLVTSLRACADAQAALRTTEALLKQRPGDTVLAAVHVPTRRAAIELQRNQPAKAIEWLRTAAPFERAYPEVIYLRGLAYLRSGSGREAATEFRKMIDYKGSTWGPRYPLALLGLARAARQSRDTAAASQAYRDFLTLWKNADPDVPALRDAKREYAALR